MHLVIEIFLMVILIKHPMWPNMPLPGPRKPTYCCVIRGRFYPFEHLQQGLLSWQIIITASKMYVLCAAFNKYYWAIQTITIEKYVNMDKSTITADMNQHYSRKIISWFHHVIQLPQSFVIIMRRCRLHDRVMTWKRFLHHWSFVVGIHLWGESPHKGPQWGALMPSLLLVWKRCYTAALLVIWDAIMVMRSRSDEFDGFRRPQC